VPSCVFSVIGAVLCTVLVVVLAMNFHVPEKRLKHRMEHLYGITDPQFKREMSVLLGPAIVGGNRIVALQNGDEIFPEMLAAIRQAQRTITFETYIYWSGQIGQQFADALIERASAGVKVRVMLDWLGSEKMSALLVSRMRAAGIEIERYHPLKWYSLGRFNNRTHRKVLVVDGVTGFTGGVGIADQWTGHAQDPNHWRDMHFLVQGPVVAQMQTAFLDNWIKTTGKVLHGAPYFPLLTEAGTQEMHLFMSSVAGGSESMRLMYLAAITAAEHSIDMEAAYFVPDDLMREELLKARGRGVRIRVLVPGKHIDSETVRIASRRAWGELLDAGIEIYEYQPTMLHCKLLVFDHYMVSIGSTNFDARSFELNDEASLNVYDADFAARMTTVFERDLTLTKSYSSRQWVQRPWSERFAEIVIRPIESQL
jgi:cardiolipin synthase A/B